MDIEGYFRHDIPNIIRIPDRSLIELFLNEFNKAH